jgi:response regulator of citrate/malate metabolism
MKTNQVLLIDDDNIQHFIAKATLKKIDSEIKLLSYLDAISALEYLSAIELEENLPNLILLDINMPEMDGWQFLEKYKNFKLKSDVYIVSSSIDTSDINKSKGYTDVKQFVSKPLDFDKICAILNKQEI